MAGYPGPQAVTGPLISSASFYYEVQELLGSGCFGLVIQCRKLTTNETVALKIYRSKSSIEEAKQEVKHKSCALTFDLNNDWKTYCMHVKSLPDFSCHPRRLSSQR